MNNRADFSQIEEYVRQSAIVRTIDALGEAWRAAVEDSSTAGRIRRIRSRFLMLPLAVRVRAVAIAVASAAGAYLLLLRVVPAQVAPAIPRTLWPLAFASATATAIVADRLAASWDSSSLRRLWGALGRADR